MSSEFNFFQHWYPLSPLEDLDPTQPTAVTLLGMRLVIWKPKSSENYRVFLDQCPHRLAPLSEGRIDPKTGHLACSYHGWQFDAEGVCTQIPQAENPQILVENQQLCAVTLPTRQEQDLLWVWADPKSAALAATVELPLSPQIDATKGFIWSSFVRDLEYDWQTLVENVADPSHVPFAHHGVQGNRDKAAPMPIKIVQSTQDLVEATTPRATITFQPPCHLEYAINLGKPGQQVGLVTYCIPVAPGKSRIVAQFPRNFAKTLAQFTPRWWNHIQIRNPVLDGDMILLCQQEYFLQQRQPQENWKTAYKLPTSSDRLVIEFRKWFDKYCDAQLPWQEVGVTAPNKEIFSEDRQFFLDRYKQHTQHCHSCRNALSTVQRVQQVLLAYFAIAVSVVAVMPDSLRLRFGIPFMVVALLGLTTYTWLKFWLEPKFYFVDYLHAKQ